MNQRSSRTREIRANNNEPTSRRTIVSRVILGIVALALLAGMIAQFTPNLGNAGTAQTEGPTALLVNGTPVTERELERLKSGNQVLSMNLGGVMAQDIQNLIVDQAVLISAVQQDSARMRVGSGEVRDFIAKLRQEQNLQKDSDYLARIQQFGYTDTGFREAVRQQLALQKRIEELQNGVKLTDQEAKLFFELNRAKYANEARIVARQIVLDDKAAADAALARVRAGEDFGTLARTLSTTLKKEDGALGAQAGKTVPQPVTRLALPTAVADAAFKLQPGQTTGVVADGGKFHIVKVEKRLPAGPKTFEEARATVQTDALQLKKNQVIEAWVEGLQRNAKVSFPKGSTLDQYNPPVATVGAKEIRLADLNRNIYFNPQIGQFITQGGEQGASLVQDFFKAQSLENLVNQEVAVQAARASGQPFVGSAAEVLGAIQQYQTRDLKVTDAEVRAYYDKNLASYTTPASANLVQATFPSLKAARAFRTSFIASGGNFTKLATAAKATVNELGKVTADAADPAFAKAVFETPDLTGAGAGQVSQVIEQAGQSDGEAGEATPPTTFSLLYVTGKTAARVQPFAEVRDDAADKALATKRATAGQAWLEAERAKAKVTNSLEAVNKELAARAAKAAAAQPATPAPAAKGAAPANPNAPAPAGASSPATEPAPPAQSPPAASPPAQSR